MKIVTAGEMQEIDRRTIVELRIPSLVLMERAGLAVISAIKERFGRKKIIVVCGSGNNGGDGMVTARNLHNEGWDVQVFLTSKPDELRADAFIQFRAATECGVRILPVEELLAGRSTIFRKHSVIVDAILGTGLSRSVSGKMCRVIKALNDSELPVISVDMPSGISSDTGQVMGDAVRSECTVTFGLPKRGHYLYPGAGYAGNLLIADIGFPAELLESEALGVELLEKGCISSLIPPRRKYSHKGTYGHVLIVAGSAGKIGAALMAARACIRTGAGLVTMGVPESLSGIFQTRVTEEMILPLPDRGGMLSEKASYEILSFLDKSADLLAIGPGIGESAGIRKLIRKVIENSAVPVVIDADGINSARGGRELFNNAKAPVILTPHPGEMARLLQHLAGAIPAKEKSSDTGRGRMAELPKELVRAIEEDRINSAISFAKMTGTHLVLKGVPTVIAAPGTRAFVNSTGNPGMATAGAGDVLTGMISGFLSQTGNLLNSCILGVYAHGLAGDIAAAEKGEHCLIATDIIEKIPAAFHSLMQSRNEI
jgi:ADP-dependent NAD(P)H-hydrate dehydratase / NAD(P)H-hydrate epimerase